MVRKAYKDAIATIRAAYIAQACNREAAARVMDHWMAYPECTSVDMAAALKLNQSNAPRRMAEIRRIANALYPNGVSAHYSHSFADRARRKAGHRLSKNPCFKRGRSEVF